MTRTDFFNFIKKPNDTKTCLAKSTEYYLKIYDHYHTKKWFSSWNWAAFIFGPAWFLYRQMYLYAFLVIPSFLVYVGFQYAHVMFSKIEFFKDIKIQTLKSFIDLPLLIGILLYSFIMVHLAIGIFANFLYLRFARKKLATKN